ncbi:MAG: hypothetical protein U0414_43340 [Polyangiaceae bacterium]
MEERHSAVRTQTDELREQPLEMVVSRDAFAPLAAAAEESECADELVVDVAGREQPVVANLHEAERL